MQTDSSTQDAPMPDGAAIDRWRQRIRADTFARYHLSMGEALEKQGSVEPALVQYRRAIEILPDLDEAHFRLVDLLQRHGLPGEAEQAHEAARSVNPRYRPDALKRIGIRHLIESRYDEALEAFSEIEAVDTSDMEAVWYRAIALAMTGRSADLQNLVADLEPGDFRSEAVAQESWRGAERLLLHDAWHAGTKQILYCLTELAVRFDDDNNAAADVYCLVRYVFRDPEGIIAFGCRDRRWQGRSVIALAYNGWAYALLGNWAEAERRLRGVMAAGFTFYPYVDFAVAGIGFAMCATGRRDDAVRFLTDQHGLQPNAFWIPRALGALTLQSGDVEGAIRCLEASRRTNDQFLPLQIDIALCRLMAGDVVTARSIINGVRRDAGTTFRLLIPGDPWTGIVSTLVCEAEGSSAEAVDIYRAEVEPHARLLVFYEQVLPGSARDALDRVRSRMTQ